MQVFNISMYISVPIAGAAVWLLVVKGNYKIAERIFLVFSAFLLCYVVSAIMAKPDWGQVGHAMVHPQIQFKTDYIAMVIGLVGTTIAPWMQFYMQSAVIEKGLKIEDYKYTLVDVAVGCVLTIVVAVFIMVSCASTLHLNHININEAKDAAMALKPLAGNLASTIFALGLFIAAIFSATILPVATAFYVCEAFGFEAGIDKRIDEAPQFYALFTGILLIGMGIILIPNAPLIQISVWSQVINGILLPVVLVCMLLLVNNKEVMGEHVNGMVSNVVGWGMTAILGILSAYLVISAVL